MSDRFTGRMRDAAVQSDTRIVAGLAAIYCADHHKDRDRVPLVSDASRLGVYRRRAPVLCEECAEHIRYAEKRRAFCPRDPKPFCAHCDTHCYTAAEAEWQRQMMRYAGPRSIWHGYAIAGMRHALEARKWKRKMAKRGGVNTATDDDGAAR